MINKEKAEELLQKFREERCSADELALLESWYNEFVPQEQRPLSEAAWQEDMQSIIRHFDGRYQPAKSILFWRAAAAAASVIILLSLGLLFRQRNAHREHTGAVVSHDVPPGGNKAMLKLSNGQTILLSEAANGRIASEGSTGINKTAPGELTYQAAAGDNAEAGFNTITTPRGGQYHVILADGTGIWLNAASSVTYPAFFSGKERKVSITGEAYFEVAHDARKPFIVTCRNQQLRVLGTHFDINSYDDEPEVITTLLQGSVRINESTLLTPGQAAFVTSGNVQISAADMEQAVAWKNNKFMFEDIDIQTVMRMISRWYDVDIHYEGEITQEKFGGSVSRFANVSQVLSILQMTEKVHFKVEDGSITVTK